MIYLAWKVLGDLSHFRWWEKYASQNVFLSLNFRFELWHLYKSLLPSVKGPPFTLCNFYFESPSSLIKAPTKRQYDRAQVLGVVNIRVRFMNGSMFEHDGPEITCFSFDILKDMVAC